MSTATVQPVPPTAVPPVTNVPVQPTQAPPQPTANPTNNGGDQTAQPTGTDCQMYYASVLPKLSGKPAQPAADCCKESAIQCQQPGVIMTLDLSNQKLSGSIPQEITSFNSLINLNLTTNQLTGSIPTIIGALTNLNYLTLSNNKLTGSIPDSIGNLANLAGLDISNNHISGSFPSSIGNLINLQALLVANNSMTGVLPDTMGNMNALEWVNLVGNNFSQPVPDSFQNLPNFHQFYMGNLVVDGTVPKAPKSSAPLANGWIIMIAVLVGVLVCGIISYIGTVLYKKKKEKEALDAKKDPKIVEVKKPDTKPEVSIVVDPPEVPPPVPPKNESNTEMVAGDLPRVEVTPSGGTPKSSPIRVGYQNIQLKPNHDEYPQDGFIDAPDNYATLGTNYQTRTVLSFDEPRSRKSVGSLENASRKSIGARSQQSKVPSVQNDGNADAIQIVPKMSQVSDVDSVTEEVVIPSFLIKDMENKSSYSTISRMENKSEEVYQQPFDLETTPKEHSHDTYGQDPRSHVNHKDQSAI
ncbi:hypothetical protein HK103_003271 [Boothiomyces macroporosus]|uniref:Disease resistance R13L4/SHOC-2-like LRR domain-containing protein n=1 Tax=Boothiomyces macroporosus TaxID=261099 RepID=A0AAD5U8U7_9FUNG|nr:hypothetical protein HK103_003271 [Boothiomyces macroporosus]